MQGRSGCMALKALEAVATARTDGIYRLDRPGGLVVLRYKRLYVGHAPWVIQPEASRNPRVRLEAGTVVRARVAASSVLS